ncbi:MAG: zinc ribbon domain-containing protein [Acidobacteriota bacterium]|nr:MAG: zinc ribbon domain-containing protein [Acidobacteriota bacterium]
MPIYEYRCRACDCTFERMQKFSDPPVRKCPKCGKGKVEKLISRSAIKFEGTGWYVTDYARKSARPSEASPEEGAGDAKGKKEKKEEKKKAETSSGGKKPKAKDKR